MRPHYLDARPESHCQEPTSNNKEDALSDTPTGATLVDELPTYADARDDSSPLTSTEVRYVVLLAPLPLLNGCMPAARGNGSLENGSCEVGP